MTREKETAEIGYEAGYVTSRDVTLLPKGAVPEALNVQTYKGRLTRTAGVTPIVLPSISDGGLVAFFGQPLFGEAMESVAEISIGIPLKCYHYWDVANAEHHTLISDYAIHEWTAGGWAKLSSSYVGDPDHRVSCVFWDGKLIIASAAHDLQDFDITTHELTTHPTATGIRAKAVVIFYTHLVLFHTIEAEAAQPLRVRWSATGDFDNLDDGDFSDIRETSDPLVTATLLLDRCIVYKAASMWELIYVGYPKIFSYANIHKNIGTESPDTIDEYAGGQFFLGTDDVYFFNGVSPESIGEAIREEIFGRAGILNRDYIHRAQGKVMTFLHEYWLAIPTGFNEYPDTIYIYMIDTKQWWKREANAYILHWLYAPNILCWAEATGIWAQSDNTWYDIAYSEDLLAYTYGGQTWSAYSQTFSSSQNPVCLLGDEGAIFISDWDNKLVQGVYPEAYVVSPNLTYDWEIRWVEFAAKLTGGATLYYSTDEGSSYTSLGSQSASSSDLQAVAWTFDITASAITWKIVFDEGNAQIHTLRARGVARKGGRV